MKMKVILWVRCTKTELRKSYHDKAHSSALFNLTGLLALSVNVVFCTNHELHISHLWLQDLSD